MSDPDDPFGLTNDAGRTRIRRPSPDRKAPPVQRPAAAEAVGSGEPLPRGDRLHPNRLISAFAPLLEIAPELARAAPPGDPESLRVRLLDGLVRSRDEAVGNGVQLAQADAGAWFVAALLDDLALNTPWGGQSGWPRQPLVVSLAGDVDAGSKFFDRVADLERTPNRAPELLQLAFVCLSLGFRGKYRVPGRAGDGSLAQVKATLGRLLQDPANDVRHEISPNWRGVVAADEPPRFALPLWSIAVATIALLTAIYVGMGMRLSGKAEGLFTLAGILPPQERAEIFRPVRAEPDELPEPVVFEPVTFDLLPEFEAAAPSGLAVALSGSEDATLANLIVQSTNPEVFRSARADLNTVYDPLIESVAGVILANAELISQVTVIGHTDSIPVQRSNPFSSNQGLSEARAKRIADILAGHGVDPSIISSEGRAATQPIADNGTREGRARNRRVEIRIQKGL